MRAQDRVTNMGYDFGTFIGFRGISGSPCFFPLDDLI